MPARPRPVPDDLTRRPVTAARCSAAGVSDAALRHQFTRMFRGVWWHGPLPDDLRSWVLGALLVAPHDAVVSHVTALHLWGVPIRALLPIHLSTNLPLRPRVDRLVVHRRVHPILRHVVDGLASTSPERAFVDSATILGLRDLVRAGDALVARGHLTVSELVDFCHRSHLDGVVRARRAVALVREGVESFLETDVRLLLVFARLPVDGCNVDIHDVGGRFIARGDILFSRYKVLVEYDGWQHERDARQRQKDHLRRERLEAAGWIVIVVTAEDMKKPLTIVRRVHAALVRRGFAGPDPVMSTTWQSWFAA